MYPRNFGNYVLLERIGAGGMSEIDLARRVVEDASFVRFLVIKRIKAEKNEDEAFVRMFKDEARISAELHHTNIAQVYDFGKIDDEYYLVLEYVPGIDVRRILNVTRDRGETVPLRVTLRIICDLLSGLHFAHTRVDTFGKPMNVVHRDVNPRNIMVSVRGDVKLIDFGVAKATDRLERTHTDHVKGKFAYMAPEQVAAKEIDGRVDVFAAALTLHEMVSGVGPFYGLNQVQIMHRLLAGQVPELPEHADLNPQDLVALRRVQRKALAPKPEDRYPTAEAFRKDLERVAERIGGLASPTDIAAYVQKIEPDFDQRLRDKMAAFSGPVEALPTTMELPGVQVPAGEVSGSLSKASQVTYTNITARQAGVAAMGGMAALTVAGGVAALLLAIVAAGLLAWHQGVFGSAAAHPNDAGDEPSLREVTPTPVPGASGTADPAPASPAPVDAPAPATTAPATTPGTTAAHPATTAPGAAPGPSEAAPAGGTPEPTGTPPAGTPTDAPPADTTATTAPATTAGTATATPAAEAKKGTLQVNSSPTGRAISINGTPTGKVTPAKIPWPQGETVTITVDGFAPTSVTVKDAPQITAVGVK